MEDIEPNPDTFENIRINIKALTKYLHFHITTQHLFKNPITQIKQLNKPHNQKFIASFHLYRTKIPLLLLHASSVDSSNTPKTLIPNYYNTLIITTI